MKNSETCVALVGCVDREAYVATCTDFWIQVINTSKFTTYYKRRFFNNKNYFVINEGFNSGGFNSKLFFICEKDKLFFIKEFFSRKKSKATITSWEWRVGVAHFPRFAGNHELVMDIFCWLLLPCTI